jgi:hypothetical protein
MWLQRLDTTAEELGDEEAFLGALPEKQIGRGGEAKGLPDKRPK